jgi:hypothetical protein
VLFVDCQECLKLEVEGAYKEKCRVGVAKENELDHNAFNDDWNFD